ncbi:thioesterase family protein [Viridibacillus sp. FSL R5-0477]|uniref:Thioesterase superfamily protein n=1 Tax=Viridibacillus arenosi FSL R5-213 TaxID=1227360 RepID=W4EPM0_9BACL|nr:MULTISPECIES: thioesterase family protein [Viridibacillus]ETT82533.1 thioesterase superfamily protein [Viridibacillus arenosi FSL R5-213]OMC85502.1 acyl-CoA thioester hydrolase [Viridibacillus sp. FSL H8-0123]OMC92383.1 acyl-CoA thioester hydrolase [Viridibacillus arenosi]
MQSSYISNMEEWKKGFSFSVPVQVRFSETDMFGHMNNTVPITYFEYARIEFLKHLGFMEKWMQGDEVAIPVVADIQCDYVKQVYFEEQLNIFVKIENIGNSSLDLHYLAINNKEEMCFTGRGTIVQMNRQTGKSIRWNESQLQSVQA